MFLAKYLENSWIYEYDDVKRHEIPDDLKYSSRFIFPDHIRVHTAILKDHRQRRRRVATGGGAPVATLTLANRVSE